MPIRPVRAEVFTSSKVEAALAEINADWADLLELQVVPVVEDDVAGTIAKKVYGSNRHGKTST